MIAASNSEFAITPTLQYSNDFSLTCANGFSNPTSNQGTEDMSILKSQIVPKNSGAAFEVLRGQRIRVAGRSIVDFVAFNLRDLTERFDQARTKTNHVKIFISARDILYSKRNNPMMTIVEDTFTEGRHDLQKG